MSTPTLPAAWLPRVPMKRIICHWTAGAHKANDTDKRAYHLLIEGDGTVIRGIPSIAANSDAIKTGYAAHTLNCNTDSIGVSLCCMAGAKEAPFDAGGHPMRAIQFERLAEVIAELCAAYAIPVTPQTVLSHAEVQGTLGIQQRQKWDFTRLAFDPGITGARAIGDRLRARVSALMAGEGDPAPSIVTPMPAGAKGIVTAGMLNLRRGPSTTSEGLGTIPRGTELAILDPGAEGWLQIKTPFGAQGFVAAQHVEIVDGAPAAQPTEPSPMRAHIAEIRARLIAIEDLIGA